MWEDQFQINEFFYDDIEINQFKKEPKNKKLNHINI